MKSLITDFNPDAINDRTELEDCAKALKELAFYCEVKAQAVQFRLNGEISKAIFKENNCNKIYSRLPEMVKSW